MNTDVYNSDTVIIIAIIIIAIMKVEKIKSVSLPVHVYRARTYHHPIYNSCISVNNRNPLEYLTSWSFVRISGPEQSIKIME